MLAWSKSLPVYQAAASLVSHRRNSARPRYRAAVVEPPPLVQFVVLSMLLHVLFIVLFGNPPGTARRSEGGWGPLDVTLGRQSPEPGAGFRLAPGMETSSPGSALLPSGGAANLPAESRGRSLQPTPQRPAAVDALPRLNPSAPEEVDKTLAPALLSPPTIEPVAPPEHPRERTPPAELPLRALPTLPEAPLEKAIAPGSERQLAPPVDLPLRAVPAAPAAPLQRAASPTLERELAPPVELPAHEMPATSAPLERLAPAPAESKILPPVELAPREAPIAPAAPLERLAPANIEREVAPPVELPAPRAASPTPPVAPSAPPASPAAPLAPQPLGTPEANDDIFKPRRDLGAPRGEERHIDLDAARKKAAREIVSEGAGSRGVFTVPPPPPVERKSKDPLEKAIKPDCRTAYANMGLLAVPVLVASAVAADGSCRW